VKKLLASLWLLLIAVAAYAWWRSGVSPQDSPEALSQWLQEFGLAKAAVLYVLIYTLRPLIFFPATLLTLASGLLFGPLLGIAFTIVGENLSANVAFIVARYFARDWVAKHEAAAIKKWEDRLRENGLVTVLILRLIYLPFDGVNYACGLTTMRQWDFAVGTFIGILPGLIGFVLLGSTASAGTQQPLAVFLLSLIFLIFGLLVARTIKRRQSPDEESAKDVLEIPSPRIDNGTPKPNREKS